MNNKEAIIVLCAMKACGMSAEACDLAISALQTVAGLDSWAAKMAKSFEQHGIPEGQTPKQWCDDSLLDTLLDDVDAVDALQALAEARFLAACSERGHK